MKLIDFAKIAKIPSLTKRRFSTGSEQTDRCLDELYQAVTRLQKGGNISASLAFPVLNNGGATVAVGKLYGRDSSGGVAPALADTVPPIWLAQSTAAPGKQFVAAIVGPVEALIDNVNAPGVSAAGALAWLSDSVAGSVTATAPANTRFMCGRFSSTTANGNGTIDVDLFLFPQPGVSA